MKLQKPLGQKQVSAISGNKSNSPYPASKKKTKHGKSSGKVKIKK